MEEELLQRQLPHSLEAEQSVLGSMLIDSRCVAEVIGLVRPDDFFLQQNKDIYETIYTMFNFSETIDPVTVLEKMKVRGVADEKTADYLLQLMEVTPTAANVGQYAQIVRDRAMLRNLAVAAGDIRETVFAGVGTPAEILESRLRRGGHPGGNSRKCREEDLCIAQRQRRRDPPAHRRGAGQRL